MVSASDILFITNNIHANPPLLHHVWSQQASGCRNDLPCKRKYYVLGQTGHDPSVLATVMLPRIDVLYSANVAPPSWVHVFHAVRSTSLRTQAAAIAYMFPHYLNMMTEYTALRHLTAHRRSFKLGTSLENISIPSRFISKASTRIDLCSGGRAVFVCDGGTDHNICATPPSNKVSYYYVQSFTTIWYEY